MFTQQLLSSYQALSDAVFSRWNQLHTTCLDIWKEHGEMLRKCSYGLLGISLFFLGKRFVNGRSVPSQLLKESDLRGQVVLITGASKGVIGYETVKALYCLGATVCVSVRNLERGLEEMDELERECKSMNKNLNLGKIIVMKMELDDLESVREFCHSFLQKFDRLDILINNAGVYSSPSTLSKQNLEIHFAVNHLGHFMLVHFLKSLIQQTSVEHNKECKIISVSSLGHIAVRNKDQLLFTKEKLSTPQSSPMFAYGFSKLCNLLFIKSLARQLEKLNETATSNSLKPVAKIGCYSLHPGTVSTNVFRSVDGLGSLMLQLTKWYFFKSPLAGAQTSIYLALEKMSNLESGGYYYECKQYRGESWIAKEESVQDELWKLSEELCKDYV